MKAPLRCLSLLAAITSCQASFAQTHITMEHRYSFFQAGDNEWETEYVPILWNGTQMLDMSQYQYQWYLDYEANSCGNFQPTDAGGSTIQWGRRQGAVPGKSWCMYFEVRWTDQNQQSHILVYPDFPEHLHHTNPGNGFAVAVKGISQYAGTLQYHIWNQPSWDTWHQRAISTSPTRLQDWESHYFVMDFPKHLRVTEEFLPANQEKFHRWAPNEPISYWTNWAQIDFNPLTLTNLEVQYLPTTDGGTLQSSYIDGAGPSQNFVRLADPWLPDTVDPTYGLRNRGLTPQFVATANSQNNIGISSPFKGVFLNQLVGSGVYYSISAPTQVVNGITWNFHNWIATGADGFNSTSQTTPIVFRSPGATVTANYKAHLASNAASVLAANGQRRLVSDIDGNERG